MTSPYDGHLAQLSYSQARHIRDRPLAVVSMPLYFTGPSEPGDRRVTLTAYQVSRPSRCLSGSGRMSGGTLHT